MLFVSWPNICGYEKKLIASVIKFIDCECHGEWIGWALIRNALKIFSEANLDNINLYQTTFDTNLLQATIEYYSKKGALRIGEISYKDHIIMVEECLKWKKERIGHYLHASIECNLLKKVQYELLTQYKTQLFEQ